uniref:uncharacterized protein n=1 Tax=Myxine glutinosa TaxID=7769 RepID=UPI00358DF722
MPKHLSLAMTVRHLSGSAQLISLLNGFGYCVSNSVVLNHDTALANQELHRGQDALPSIIQAGKHVTLVWDNNDFGEETLSGRGTTHNTNGIIIQRPSQSHEVVQPAPVTTVKRTQERSMQPPAVNLATYYGGKKEGPAPFATSVPLDRATYFPLLQHPKTIDLAYHITKYNIDGTLPSWTGFNQLLSCVEVPPKSVIGYLPVIDATPTEMNTVLTILQRSVQIADKLQLEAVVIVVDQAIYCKAQLIRWKNAQFMKRLVIRLGAFHTAMSFLGCIGKRFRDGGLQDILVESEIVAVGSVNGVFSGKHYNRAVRAHKLMSDAMQQMLLDAYFESIPEHEAGRVKELLSNLAEAFPDPNYHVILNSDKFKDFKTSFDKFLEASDTKPTFRFWSSYIETVELLLLFIRGTREANWDVHLASIRCMLPWKFAYDHINYSRYLPVYWLEMSDVQQTHPTIHQKFMESEFATQRSDKAFAQIACDQTIEQTANRDSKTKGGMTGFTTSKGTVNRWIWSHHARESIARECEVMARKSRYEEHSSTRSDLLQSRMLRDKADVDKIIEMTNSMINPFEYDGEDLVHVTSGVVATREVQEDLNTAYERGETEFTTLCKERLQTETVDLFGSMKKLKLKTFTNMSKAVKKKIRGKDVSLKADRNLLARLVVIGQFRKIDLQELMSYSLGPLPLPLASVQGCLVKTNKANLLHALESQAEKPVVDIPVGGMYVMDGMAMIQKLNINKLTGERTFLNLAHEILKRLVKEAEGNKSSEIHFVTDTYRKVSIKNAEREKRAARGSQVMQIYGQSLPQQWKKFLSNGDNKESLIEYLFETWSKVKTAYLRGITVFLAHGTKCHIFTGSSTPDQVVEVKEEPSLNSTHEEADTRMFLHAAHAAHTSNDVIIVSPDTDVFIIGIALVPQISAHLYFHTGKGVNLRTIDLKAIYDSIGDDVSQALIGLHCFTGCDSVSAFYGKGKKKALNLILKNPELCGALKDLGERFDIHPDMMEALETFVCKLYGQHNITTVNEARYNMFRLARTSEITMPPNQDALRQHIKRANYQAGIYKRSLQPIPDIPDPDGYGWMMEEELAINWMTLPPAPDSVMELANCTGSCKKTRCSNETTCTCLQNNIPCTDLCKCGRNDCSNITGHVDFDDKNDDKDSRSEDEEDSDAEEDEITALFV